MNAISHQIQLLRRPTGLPTLEDFALRDVPLPALQEGEVQVANQWLSVDPYMRGRMSEAKSYVPPFPLNGPLDGGAIGTVQASRHPDFKVGDKVSSMLGWRDAFVANAAQLTRLPDTTLPPQRFLGALGMPGMTAWAGLHKVAHLKAGETLLVSAASGAVGTMVVQLAKQAGARVIGSTGSADKVAYLKTLGADAVINYRETPISTPSWPASPPRASTSTSRTWGAPCWMPPSTTWWCTGASCCAASSSSTTATARPAARATSPR